MRPAIDRPTSWTLANGETDSRSYDLDGRISADPVNAQIGYDAASRITSLSLGNHSLLTGNKTYGYDALDRLTSYTGNGGPISYTYDANGNRTQQTVAGTTTSYTVDPVSNRVTKINNGKLAYDANGSRTSLNTTARLYSYDALGQLSGYTDSSQTDQNRYNGLGQRVARIINGAEQRNAYDEAGHNIGEYLGAAVTLETVYLGDMPVVILKGPGVGSRYYVHADYLNAPRQIDDASLQVRWTWDNQPFGANGADNNPQNVGGFDYKLRFPGQYFSNGEVLYYNGHRNYDQTLGRYIESDPIGLRGGINTYSYGLNNPISLVDPFGLQGSEPALQPVCPECLFIPALRVARSLMDVMGSPSRSPGLPPPGIEPPIQNPESCTVGPSTRGDGSSLHDPNGGEWRYADGDSWHNPHWDYNPWDNWNSPWQNIPIDGLPPVKPGP